MDTRGSFKSTNDYKHSNMSRTGGSANANPLNNFQTTNLDYGQNWLVKDAKTLQELGDNDIKLRYLEKSLKSQRRLQQRELTKQQEVAGQSDEMVNEKYKFDKNAVVAKKFPFKADEFHYPNDGKEKPKSLYIKYNDEYGSKKPNDLELPGKNINYLTYF
jgi:hypothetical protein